MELIHARSRKYKGQWVWPGDPVEDYTDAQARAMVACGQAYWKEEEKQYPYHTGGGWYRLSNGESVKGREQSERAQSEL